METMHVTTPVTASEVQQQAPRILGTIRKLFTTLRMAPNQDASLRNIVEFVAASEREISEKRSSHNSAFAALLKECEQTMIETNLDAGCEVYRIVANMTLADAYARRQRTVASLWSCLKRPEVLAYLKGPPEAASAASSQVIDLVMYLISSSPTPLTTPLASSLAALDIITADCVAWLSSSQSDTTRRLFACDLLTVMIANEIGSVRSLNHVRELTVTLLWDIALRSIAAGLMQFATRVAQLCTTMTAVLLDSTASTAQEELEKYVVDSLSAANAGALLAGSGPSADGTPVTKDILREARRPLCGLLMMSELLNQNVWSREQRLIDVCQGALISFDWHLPACAATSASPQSAASPSPVINTSSLGAPQEPLSYSHCLYVAAAALMRQSTSFSVDITAIFDKLLRMLVCVSHIQPSPDPLTDAPQKVSLEDRSFAADALADTVSHWGTPARLEVVFKALVPIFAATTDQVHERHDAPLLRLVEVMGAHDGACSLPLVFSLLSVVGANGSAAQCQEVDQRVTLLAVTRRLLSVAKRISEPSLQQAPIHAATLISFDARSPKEILVESLTIMAVCNYTQRLEHALNLFKHDALSVRRAAVSAIMAIIAAHIKATNATTSAVKLDNTVAIMVERLLDVAIIDMDSSLRHHVLSSLGRPFDAYLSMPDNIATLFMAYHDVDLACSEASLSLLCRLLVLHPAQILQGLTRLQEDLLKEIEERNPVAVTIAAARRLNLMIEKGTILISCKQIERVLLDKLNPAHPMGPFTHPLVVELLGVLHNTIESPSALHEDLAPICRLAVTFAKEGASCQIRVAAFMVIRAVMRTKQGVLRNEQQSHPEVYSLLEEVINDSVAQMDATRMEAMSAFGAFGAVNPVTMRTLRKTAEDEGTAPLVTTDTTGLNKPLARTHPMLEDTYPSVALYLLVRAMQGAELDKQEAAYGCILDMLRETSVAHKQQLISSFMPLLRRTLSEPESAPLHAYVLEILVDLSPLLRSGDGAAEGNRLMACLGQYCSTPDAALAPLSSLVVTLLDELSKALPPAAMLSHRWAIDFILARLNNDMDDPDLVLRVIQSLESFSSFMKDKDLRHVVPQVLHCLCSPPIDKVLVAVTPSSQGANPPALLASINTLASRHDPNTSVLAFTQRAGSPASRTHSTSVNASLVGMSRMINGSCLEFVNQIVLKHHVLARDLCALIVHRILEFVATKTDPTICDLAMSTLVSLLASVDKAGRRFMEPIVRAASRNSAVTKSEHYITISRALQGHAPITDQKVKLPAVADRADAGQGELLFKIVCGIPQVTKGAFVQEMWSMRIGPQHVLVLSIVSKDGQSIVDFKFAPNPEADRNAKEFLKAARDQHSSLYRNLRIVDVQSQKQGIGAENVSFLQFTASMSTHRGARKVEARWLEWLHKLCVSLLECSPHSALRAMVGIARIDREVSVAAFPFAVTSVLSNLQPDHRDTMMRNLNASLVVCPFDVKRVLFELAEFMEGQRLTTYVAPKEVRCIVRRATPDAKFGINYDQERHIVVTRLAPGGPGEIARVPVGAILLSINGEGVRSVSDIPQMIKGKCEIELVLTPPADAKSEMPRYLDVPTMARVSNDCQLHAKAIYFNEQLFDRIVSSMEKECASGSAALQSISAAQGSSSSAAPSASAASPRNATEQLQPCVESLISTYQHLGLTMEAKGVVSFINEKVSDRIIPERFDFDQAATLEQLNWWQDAKRLYESRMDADSSCLLGAVRCWDALGDMRKIVNVVEDRGEGLTQDVLESLQKYRGNAALILGEWATLDAIGANPQTLEELDVVPRVAVLLRQNRAQEATTIIRRAREELFERFADGFSEGYVRAYDLLVEAQHLNHLVEVIDYTRANEEKRAVMRSVWTTRLMQMAPKPRHWRMTIAINSLSLSPEEDMTCRLETALLCSKSQQRSLAEHILLQLLQSNEIDSLSNWNEQNPQLLAAYAQHMFYAAPTDEERKSVYGHLARVLDAEKMPAAGSAAAEGWASCWLLLGEWSPQFTTNHEITLDQLRNAAELNAKNATTFHYLGRAHQALAMAGTKQDARSHVAQAITALFRAVQLSGAQKSNLQSILRILSMWFAHGDDYAVNEAMSKGIVSTDISVWLGVVPQLLARMEISSRVIRDLLSDLLIRVGESFPQALIYPLTVSKKKAVAGRALEGIQQVNAELVSMASQISNELVRIAILWHEKWVETLKRAAKTPTDCTEIMKRLQSLYTELEHAATPNEQNFVQTHRQTLAAAWGALQRKEDGPAWSYLKKVYAYLSKINDKRLYLRDVSPILAEMSSSVVAVPGTFHPSKPVISIASFQPKVVVMASKQKPRRFGIIGSDGQVYRFLLKGHEDLRQDQRIMQFIQLVNSFFLNDANSIEHGYAIPKYAVIPLTENVGILGWVENTETVFKMLEQRRQDHSIDIYLEINMIIGKGGLANIDQYSQQPRAKRADLLRHVSNSCPSNELALIIWERNETCEGWLEYRKLYAQTFALMSMVGYVLGLGDRHLNNLMLQHGGNLVHIDFGDCFEVAMQRQSFAEAVPFRLTRLMVKALGITGVDGAYRITCENVMKLLRRNRENLITILETFLYDPLINWGCELEEEPRKVPQEEPQPAGPTVLSCSLSTRKNLLGNALLTDEWAVLSNFIRQGGDRARRAAPLPHGYESVQLPEAIEQVRIAVREENYPLANGWMQHIHRIAGDVCVNSIFEQSVREKRSMAANKALSRVQAKLNGTDFAPDAAPMVATPSPTSPLRGSAILESMIEKGGARISSPGEFGTTPWAGTGLISLDPISPSARPLPVREQVDRLIDEATSFDNLAEAFITGWAPFW